MLLARVSCNLSRCCAAGVSYRCVAYLSTRLMLVVSSRKSHQHCVHLALATLDRGDHLYLGDSCSVLLGFVLYRPSYYLSTLCFNLFSYSVGQSQAL